MANKAENTMDLSKKVDEFLELGEEMMNLFVKYIKANTKTNTQANAKTNSNVIAEKKAQQMTETDTGTLKKETGDNKKQRLEVNQDIENKMLQEMDNLMKNFKKTRQETMAIINDKNSVEEKTTPIIKASQEPIKDSQEPMNEAEKLIIKDVNTLEEMTENTQTHLNATLHGIDTGELDKKSALRNCGEKFIELDDKRLAVNNKINDYCSNFSMRTQEKFTSWMLNHLQKINDKVEKMRESVTQNFISKVQTKLDKEVNSKNNNQKLDHEKIDKPLVKENNSAEKLKAILNDLEKNINGIKGDIQLVEDRLKEAEQVVGVKTEIDPKVGVFETLNGNENAGLKTVASVKEEIEDITLTDYSEHEEEAYHNGVDPDPNVATKMTDQEQELENNEKQDYEEYENYEDYEEYER
jgi:hypothetical protein